MALKFTPVSEIPNMVARCRRTYQNRILFPVTKRLALLHQLVKLVNENEAALQDALYKDLRKSSFEAKLNELVMINNEAWDAISHLKSWVKPEGVDLDLAMKMEDCTIQKDPLGVVLIIGAWNYPVQLTLMPLVGALAAGNSVVLKPSELSMESAQLMAELIAKYFDPAEVTVVNGGIAETTAVLQEKFDHILYTGNGRVARIIMAAAARNLTPVTLELGGKSPCVVDDTCDLKIAANRIAWGRFVNAGQTCIAPDYILVNRKVKGAFIEELKKSFTNFCGPNAKDCPDYARIVSDMHFKRVCGLMAGGKVVFGGQSDAATRFIAPTILDEVDVNSALMTDEIFGPLLPVIPFDEYQEAIDFINQRDKPLALYVFSNNSDFVHRVQVFTSSGALTVNDTLMHAAIATLPFGGIGESGMGAYHGKHSFNLFTHKKAVMKRKLMLEGLNDMRYPPYNAKKMNRMKWLGLIKTRADRPWGTICFASGMFILVAALAVCLVVIFKK